MADLPPLEADTGKKFKKSYPGTKQVHWTKKIKCAVTSLSADQ